MATASVPSLRSNPLVLADLFPAVRSRNAVLVALGVLFTALLAQVAVPVPGSPVPVTGQTLAVVLTAAGLGPVRGVAVQAFYILVALVGLPFYSDASGGWDVVFGATGGYVIGFIPAAYLIGMAARHGADRRFLTSAPLFAAGQAVVFAVGVPWLALTAGMHGLTPHLPTWWAGGFLEDPDDVRQDADAVGRSYHVPHAFARGQG